MGKRGPAPLPTNVKLLHGVDKKNPSRINRSEPKPAPIDVVPPPWLRPEAAKVWARLAPDLIAKGVLTAWDVDSFADLCNLIVVNQQAMEDVLAHGVKCTTPVRELADGTVIYDLRRNPAWQVARESTTLITTLGGRFGLNPSDRQQLSIGDGNSGNPDDDLLT